MTKHAAKAFLEKQNWTCKPCSCPGKKGYDCARKKKRGFVIKLRGSSFKILNRGIAIAIAFNDKLEEKLKENELFETVTETK